MITIILPACRANFPGSLENIFIFSPNRALFFAKCLVYRTKIDSICSAVYSPKLGSWEVTPPAMQELQVVLLANV